MLIGDISHIVCDLDIAVCCLDLIVCHLDLFAGNSCFSVAVCRCVDFRLASVINMCHQIKSSLTYCLPEDRLCQTGHSDMSH